MRLSEMLDGLPPALSRQVFTHASWSERRGDSYDRLAFLGDSVLSLALTSYLYPRLTPDRYGAGRLTKIRARAVSGPACLQVADRLDLGGRLAAAAPPDHAAAVPSLLTTRVLSSITEAAIGACYLHYGYEQTAEAVVEAFEPEIEAALENPGDSKSTLQELLARRGETVDYRVTEEKGPPHARTYTVVAEVAGRPLGSGEGRSKKQAEQRAAQAAAASFAKGSG